MLLTTLPLLLATAGMPDPPWLSLWEQCRNETTPEVRLACYDALGREAEHAGKVAAANVTHSATEGVFQLNRNAVSGDLTLRHPLANGNVLEISCVSNITQLRLILGKPWQGERIESQLDGVTVRENWFVRNRGLLLESGRGLSAIEVLKRWIGHREWVLSNANGEVIRVDISAVDEALRPLRQQCRW